MDEEGSDASEGYQPTESAEEEESEDDDDDDSDASVEDRWACVGVFVKAQKMLGTLCVCVCVCVPPALRTVVPFWLGIGQCRCEASNRCTMLKCSAS